MHLDHVPYKMCCVDKIQGNGVNCSAVKKKSSSKVIMLVDQIKSQNNETFVIDYLCSWTALPNQSFCHCATGKYEQPQTAEVKCLFCGPKVQEGML